ncbi:MAG: glycoside hydrolase family 15 protein [Patescibacteria group bacterium]|jgi:GH15 family glucan-1,4-alpha-glucosidase
MTTPINIQKIISTSKEVIKGCALENGAIVAANTDKAYSPREAADYRYVWIRDAAFVCVAAEYLKLPIQENFFNWVNDRPEDFHTDKLLYSNYSTNGRIATMGKQFQADQTGILLWVIHHYFKKDLKKALKFKELIQRLADGLASQWDKDHFVTPTTDVWEMLERKTSTRLKNNFTYSLAACVRGLFCANEIIPNHLWKETAMQMTQQIDEAYQKEKKYFFRNQGVISDPNIDASMLGLVYPCKIYEADDARMINTVQKIEENIVVKGGVHRFQFDYFDSEGSAQEGGGAWPVLNCWMSIYYAIKGNKTKAHQYFDWVVERSKKFNYYLPEQYFDDIRVGIYPLAWSHAMFVITARHLGYI